MRIFLIALLLCGCTTVRTEYVQIPIQRPTRPEFTRIDRKDLACLSLQTKLKIVEWINQMSSYTLELEAIIDSTQPLKED